jgi:hypothetical protein
MAPDAVASGISAIVPLENVCTGTTETISELGQAASVRRVDGLYPTSPIPVKKLCHCHVSFTDHS